MHRTAVDLADELNKYVVRKGGINKKNREDLCKLIAEAIWLPMLAQPASIALESITAAIMIATAIIILPIMF